MKKLTYLTVASYFLTVFSMFGEKVSSKEVESMFEQKVKLWKESITPKVIPGQINVSSDRKINTKEFHDLSALGPRILPLIFEKRKNDHLLTFLIPSITKAYAENYFVKKSQVYLWYDYPSFSYTPKYLWQSKGIKEEKDFWTYWWEDGRKLTPELFQKKYSLYLNAQKENNKENIKKYFEEVKNLGIVAFPQLLAEITKGDKSLIPIFSYWNNADTPSDARIEDCVKWWNENKHQYADVLSY